MAVLLLITKNQTKNPLHSEGDIIGIFDDDHPFTDHEREVFGFLTIKGSREEVEEKLYAPVTFEMKKSASRPKFILTVAPLTTNEKAQLTSKGALDASVATILPKLVKSFSTDILNW